MTAPANTQQSRDIMAKRKDATPKAKQRNGARGKDPHMTLAATRSEHMNTSSYANCELVDPDKPLTDKQKAFVKFWAEGDSIQGASRKAGYADGGTLAYRMVRMPNVLALKSQLSAQYEEAAGMDRKQVMEGFKEAIEMAKLMAEPANMIAGWREIGKMCGYYAPVETKVKIDVSGSVIMTTLTAMTDAELLELIEKAPHDRTAHSQPLLSNEIDDVTDV